MQISAGRTHSAAWTAPPSPRCSPGQFRLVQLGLPSVVPAQYAALVEVQPEVIQASPSSFFGPDDVIMEASQFFKLPGKGSIFRTIVVFVNRRLGTVSASRCAGHG